MTNRRTLKKFNLAPGGERHTFFNVEIPFATERISVELRFETKSLTQIPLALYDESNRLRAVRVSEYVRGPVTVNVWVGVDDAGPGGLPGLIGAGNWKIVVYQRYLVEETTCEVTVDIETSVQPKPAPNTSEGRLYHWPGARLRPGAITSNSAWFCGELHVHSSHSTGRSDVSTIVSVARERNVDFVAITDHFTVSHWRDIDALPAGDRPLLIHSTELSGEFGHANLHGIGTWIDPFVDANHGLNKFLGRGRYTMSDVAAAVREQGGLFCINHPLSAKVGWRYADFDIANADLIEVVALPDGPNSFLYPTLWDRFLCAGHRLVGVGSSDSHDPDCDGPWKLGVLRTWVQAEELSEKGIIDGLRRGEVYVTNGDSRLRLVASVHSQANPETARFEMGGVATCAADDLIEFEVELSGHPRGSLYVVRDGLIFDVFPAVGSDAIDNGREVVAFQFEGRSVDPERHSYCRVEFHEEIVAPYYVNMAYRDHTSLRALSNPIWVARER